MSVLRNLSFIINHPLNRHHKVKSLARFVNWQIVSRMFSGDVVYDWINGSKLFVRNGETGITGNIYCGLHEFSDMAFLLHLLREDDFFVDAGANVGSYTVLASAAVGAKTFCFEPVPSTYLRLSNNIKLNNIDEKVTCFNLGLGNTIGNIRFSSDQDTMNHVVLDDSLGGETVLVPISTLNEIVDIPPLLMKIDVEGYEAPVLQGADSLLKNDNLCAVILELNGSGMSYGFDEKEILKMMLGHGFKTYSYDPFERHLNDLDGKNLSEGNTLFIRNKEFVLDRLVSSPTIEIHDMSI